MTRFKFIFIVLTLLLNACVNSQSKNVKAIVGGPCEGCEAIYEYGNKNLTAIDTLPEFKELPNPIRINGTVYQNDGKTPAPDVILYVYQTNDKGIYPKKEDSRGWESIHGYLRGWIRTNATGEYTFYTSRPATYPNTTIPQHIHITVKEPDKNEYYIDSYHFKDDPNLDDKIKNKINPRGGSGVIELFATEDIQIATRDLILGLNIPNY
jgi:protocatechuate 3,4-dioxygenase beta subunit